MGVLDSVAQTPQAAVAGADLVLLAAPVGSLDGLLRAVAAAVEPTATVIDVGSVKADVVATAETLLTGGRFVGCHPMAGAEFSGVEAAKADIFAGRVCFVCPGRSSSTVAVTMAEDFWRAIGCQAVTIDPETHDRLMAERGQMRLLVNLVRRNTAAMSRLQTTQDQLARLLSNWQAEDPATQQQGQDVA